jgi:exopolysaccharide biosynthesis operon protein EpsL
MPKPRCRLPRRAFALLACFAAATPAGAGPGDGLQVVASLAYGHDDNLLRVPDGSPGFDNTRSDWWWTREAGLVFDRTYGRQRIAAVARLSKTDFDHFKALNYDGKDLQATWYWQLGNRLQGKAGASYQQVLAPYTDFLSSERNLRKTRSVYADANWRFHAAWQVRVGFQRDKYAYDAASQRFNDRTEETPELELDYLARSDSTVGLVLRRVKGSYPFLRPVGPFNLNNDFTQDELKARVKWNASGATVVEVLAGHTRRKQPSFGEGTTSGLTGKVKATWQPHGKVTYTAAVWRDFAPLESTIVSYTLNKGASAGAQWDASAKIRVNVDIVAERRNYNARGDTVPGIPGAQLQDALRDSLRTASLRATWSPRQTVQVAAGYVRQARSGAAALGTSSFTSNSVTLSASAQF